MRLECKLKELQINIDLDPIVLYQVDLNNLDSVSIMFSKLNDVTGAVNCSYPRNKNYGRHFLMCPLKISMITSP